MKIHKLIIAFVQLETAIQLFLRDKNYLCAITLAGAAEEILGKYAETVGDETAYSILTTGLVQGFNGRFSKDEVGRKFINFHRNELKHFNCTEHEMIEINPQSEAIYMIIRATCNIASLGIISENIEEFDAWVNQNRPDLMV